MAIVIRAVPIPPWLALAALVAGCYLSHERTPISEVGPDEPPLACARFEVTHQATLRDPEVSSVTPRLVALGGGEVGVIYVASDGDPVRVLFERLDASLRRPAGAIAMASDSFTWAEPALVGDALYVAYGVEAEQSIVERVGLDGASIGLPRAHVPVGHPSALVPGIDRLLWIQVDDASPTFRTRILEIDRDGLWVWPRDTPPWRTHGAVTPDLAVLARSDGARFWATPIDDGMIHTELRRRGPEALTDVNGSSVALAEMSLVDLSGAVVLIGHDGASRVMARHDPDTLRLRSTVTDDALGGPTSAVAIEGHVVVARASSRTLLVDGYDDGLRRISRTEAPIEGGERVRMASDLSMIASSRDSAVVASTIVDESGQSFPWLARITCIE